MLITFIHIPMYVCIENETCCIRLYSINKENKKKPLIYLLATIFVVRLKKMYSLHLSMHSYMHVCMPAYVNTFSMYTYIHK